MGIKIKSSEIKNWLVIIICVLIIIGFLTDFVNWRQALNIIKKDMSIKYQAQLHIFIRGYGYIPFLWRGNFKRISIDASGTSTSIGDVTDLILQIGDHNPFWIHVKGGYGNYIAKNSNQEFKEISVYVKVIPLKYYLTDHYHCDVKILVFAETEERHYLRQVNAMLTWSCGQYWYGGWVK